MKGLNGRKEVTAYAPDEYIRHLSAAVFGYQVGRRIMAFFNLYVDVSGKTYDSPFVVMAGYVASGTQWADFTKEWSCALRREGLSCWHMTDFNAGREEYKEWTETRGERVYQEMQKIIRTHISVAIASAVEVETYQKLVVSNEILQVRFGRDPYKFCLFNCMAQVGRWLVKEAISDDVAYFVEYGDEGYGEAKLAFDEIFKNKAHRTVHQLGPLTTVFKGHPSAIPCEPGDILAWECRRELIERRKTNPRSPRLSLERLLLPSDSDVVWDRETLPKLINEIPLGWKS
jgi:hypothetical protein